MNYYPSPHHEGCEPLTFAQVKASQKAAISAYGAKWTRRHDRYAYRWLFRKGLISDHYHQLLLQKLEHEEDLLRKNNPNSGKFRVW